MLQHDTPGSHERRPGWTAAGWMREGKQCKTNTYAPGRLHPVNRVQGGHTRVATAALSGDLRTEGARKEHAQKMHQPVGNSAER